MFWCVAHVYGCVARGGSLLTHARALRLAGGGTFPRKSCPSATAPSKYAGRDRSAHRRTNRPPRQFQSFAVLRQALPGHHGASLFGARPSLAGNLPLTGIELGKDFLAGGLAGALATVGVYPFDVLRTRFVAQPNHMVPALSFEGTAGH